MKSRPILIIGLLLCLGLLSTSVVQAPWNFVLTEWQGQYTIDVGQYLSWGANRTDTDKWNANCSVVGQGDINFYLFSQNHYETYVSQFGFAFASELFEHVTTVSFEHEFSSTTGWWIVVENDYSDNVTIDLRVDLYSWTDPTTGTIPGFPGGSILIGIFVALMAIIIIRRKRTE